MQDIVKKIKEQCLQRISLTQSQAKRFFKTASGQYAQHDQFLGIRVPDLRKIAKIYQDADLSVIKELMESKYNEERFVGLLILVHKYSKADVNLQTIIFQFYLDNRAFVNNWNLVDMSAYKIVGHYLQDKDRSILEKLAKSNNLWDRRISIVATLHFIRNFDLSSTFKVAKILLNDKQDLIHKAVGWMLREAGKKDLDSLINFLQNNFTKIPKTTLRYAIEKLSPTNKLALKFSN